MAVRQRLGIGHVQHRPQPAAGDLGEQRVGVDHRSARGVDQQRPVAHRRELGGADQAAGGVGQRREQHDRVGVRQQRRRARRCRATPSRAREATPTTVVPSAWSRARSSRPIEPMPTTSTVQASRSGRGWRPSQVCRRVAFQQAACRPPAARRGSTRRPGASRAPRALHSVACGGTTSSSRSTPAVSTCTTDSPVSSGQEIHDGAGPEVGNEEVDGAQSGPRGQDLDVGGRALPDRPTAAGTAARVAVGGHRPS